MNGALAKVHETVMGSVNSLTGTLLTPETAGYENDVLKEGITDGPDLC